MRPVKTCIVLFIFLVMCSLPQSMVASTEVERWTIEPWQSQNMASWGNDRLVVDFGANGLWHYDGAWIRLSHWDAENILVWGTSHLVVDFGSHGLWTYDGRDWTKIAIGNL